MNKFWMDIDFPVSPDQNESTQHQCPEPETNTIEKEWAHVLHPHPLCRKGKAPDQSCQQQQEFGFNDRRFHAGIAEKDVVS
jgi:hypothetical protein